MGYRELAKLHQLYDGYRQRVHLAGGEWLLLQEAGKLYLIGNRCPHRGAPLHNASLVGECSLRCPQHGLLFDLRTGLAQGCPDRLPYLPLVYEGNGVGVYLPG